MIEKFIKRFWKDGDQKHRILLCVAAVLGVALLTVAICALTTGCQSDDWKVTGPATTPRPAPQIPLASAQNDLLKIAIDAQGTEEKVCYLTFDDGPTTTVTPTVLDVLKQYDVKATFFMLGRMIEKNPDIAKRVYDEGHLLANHSYSHVYKDLYATGESFIAEIEKVESLIRDVTGEEPFKLIRFPGGSHNAGAYAAEKQQYKLLLQEKGYYFADWNALNGDAEGGARSATQLVERLKATATQKNIVVLMHDAADKKTTAEALPAIIEYLKSQGYMFRRMDEIPYYPKPEETVEPSMVL